MGLGPHLKKSNIVYVILAESGVHSFLLGYKMQLCVQTSDLRLCAKSDKNN